MFRFFFVFFVFVWSQNLQAKVIKFSEEELSKDSALPVFRNRVMVKKPRVKLKNKFGFDFTGGIGLVQPIFREYHVGVQAKYYFSERGALAVSYAYWKRTLSKDGKELKKTINPENPENPDKIRLEATPTIKHLYFADYIYNAFYGKISLSKVRVINLLFNGGVGVGGLKIGDKTKVGGRLTLGQQLYFSPYMALNLEVSVLFYQAPNPFEPKHSTSLPSEGEAPFDSFETKWFVRPVLKGGFSFLF